MRGREILINFPPTRLFSFTLGKVSLVPLMIAVLMILYGISGIYQPAVQASIPLIAEKQLFMQGNAVINTVSTLAGLPGSIIGGVLFGTLGITQGAMGLQIKAILTVSIS